MYTNSEHETTVLIKLKILYLTLKTRSSLTIREVYLPSLNSSRQLLVWPIRQSYYVHIYVEITHADRYTIPTKRLRYTFGANNAHEVHESYCGTSKYVHQWHTIWSQNTYRILTRRYIDVLGHHVQDYSTLRYGQTLNSASRFARYKPDYRPTRGRETVRQATLCEYSNHAPDLYYLHDTHIPLRSVSPVEFTKVIHSNNVTYTEEIPHFPEYNAHCLYQNLSQNLNLFI